MIRKAALTATLAAALLAGGHSPAESEKSAPAAAQVCYKTVCFPASITVGENEVPAIGAARLTWLMMDIYWAAFYTTPEAISEDRLFDDVPRVLIIEYNRSFDVEDFVDSSEKLLRRNKNVDVAAIREELDAMNMLYRPVVDGDRYEVRYEPGKGTTLSLNGEALGTVEGAEFAAAYFRMWIDEEKPIDKGLCKQLLGEVTSRNVRRDPAPSTQ